MKNTPPEKDISLLSSYSEDELTSLRRDMVRFAVLQLRDDAAEDAVQESIAAALAGAQHFRNHSQLKTWVFAILKNKIIDIIRERARHPTSTLSSDGPADNDAYDELFDEKGYWKEDHRPSDWGDPEKSFSNKQFWEVFQLCLDHLPENTARVFMMREVLGFETKEICNELTISSSNCWVLLHRARMSLRLCLEHRWFRTEDLHADL